MSKEGAKGARAALYYPYIHVRSEHWLKASCLCFPAIKRIVPQGYEPEDPNSIRLYSQPNGNSEPLLQSVAAYSPAAGSAQSRLLQVLRENERKLNRFRKGSAPTRDLYFIHDAKFTGELLDFLRSERLAWSGNPSRPYGHRSWLAIHPRLGRALMTTLGLSIAREQGLDLVTHSGRYHEALLVTREEEIADALFSERKLPSARPLPEVQSRLSEMVIAFAGINLESLRAEHLYELRASQEFEAFQHVLRQAAFRVRPDVDEGEFDRQVTHDARDIVTAWRNAGKAQRKELREALLTTGMEAGEQFLQASAGGPAWISVATGTIAVGLLTWKGARAYRAHRKANQHFLTQVHGAQDSRIRVRFPLGLEK